MSKTTWIIFAIACVALLGGLIFLSSQNRVSVDVDDINEHQVLGPSESSGEIGDHVYGNRESDVVLIEYVDYQCDGCAAAYPQVQSIIDDYGDDIAVVVRSFPFLQPHGMAAASAAEAAGLQGKYSEMAGVLFSNQSSWASLGAADRDERFAEYANNLGLDVDKFTADRSSSEVRSKIAFDRALGSKSGVSATPTFFLGGELVDPSVRMDEEAFRELIEAAIKSHSDNEQEDSES